VLILDTVNELQPVAPTTLIDVSGDSVEAKLISFIQRDRTISFGFAIQRYLGDLFVHIMILDDLGVAELSASASSKVSLASFRMVSNVDFNVGPCIVPILCCIGHQPNVSELYNVIMRFLKRKSRLKTYFPPNPALVSGFPQCNSLMQSSGGWLLSVDITWIICVNDERIETPQAKSHSEILDVVKGHG